MTFRTSALSLAAALLAGAAHAQILTPPSPAGLGRALDLTVRGAFVERPATSETAPNDAPWRTAIDHRFADDAVVGQIGYLCGIDGYPSNSQDAGGGGPLSGFGQRGTFLGAKLGYAFK